MFCNLPVGFILHLLKNLFEICFKCVFLFQVRILKHPHVYVSINENVLNWNFSNLRPLRMHQTHQCAAGQPVWSHFQQCAVNELSSRMNKITINVSRFLLFFLLCSLFSFSFKQAARLYQSKGQIYQNFWSTHFTMFLLLHNAHGDAHFRRTIIPIAVRFLHTLAELGAYFKI